MIIILLIYILLCFFFQKVTLSLMSIPILYLYSMISITAEREVQVPSL